MKNVKNSVEITGFVAMDANITKFETATVARCPISVARTEKNSEGKTERASALINVEAWRKNENAESLDLLKKGTLVTINAYIKPEEWTDKDGKKQSRIIFVATHIIETPDKEEEPTAEPEAKPAKKKAKK